MKQRENVDLFPKKIFYFQQTALIAHLSAIGNRNVVSH